MIQLIHWDTSQLKHQENKKKITRKVSNLTQGCCNERVNACVVLYAYVYCNCVPLCGKF